MRQLLIKISNDKPVMEIIEKARVINNKIGEYQVNNNEFTMIGYFSENDDGGLFTDLQTEYDIEILSLLMDIDI